jgi:hypothetical protein
MTGPLHDRIASPEYWQNIPTVHDTPPGILNGALGLIINPRSLSSIDSVYNRSLTSQNRVVNLIQTGEMLEIPYPNSVLKIVEDSRTLKMGNMT